MGNTGTAGQRPWWQIRTVGREGFEFGLDVVTPVSWKIVRSKQCGHALYSLSLPDPDTLAYKKWLREHRGKVVIASAIELRNQIRALCIPS